MRAIGEGIAILLRKDPGYAAFARDVAVDGYLDGACRQFLELMESTEDPVNRILARFRAPMPDQASAIATFTRRFADRIDEPIDAYEHGTSPPPRAGGSSTSTARSLPGISSTAPRPARTQQGEPFMPPSTTSCASSGQESSPLVADAPGSLRIDGFLLFVTAATAIAGFLYGYDTGIISGAPIPIKDEFHLDHRMQEFVTSAILVGAIFGALSGGWAIERFGRGWTIAGLACV